MAQAAGRYFDGRTAARHRVDVTLDRAAGVLVFSGESVTEQRWPLAWLRALTDHARDYGLTVTLHGESGDESPRDAARLSFSEPGLIAELRALCPDLTRRDVHRGSWGRIGRRAAVAVAAIVLMLFVILPRMADTLAGIIPVEREIAFGRSVTAQMERALGGAILGDLRCDATGGRAALDTMLTRLTDGRDLQYEIDVLVFDHPMLNAFAAPGGQVVLMRGLLENASGPDAVAAVLAHEIGHVERRDATRHALRAAGSAGLLSMILGDFTGGTLAVILGERMLQASYTREAEREADLFALDMLGAAGVDSSGMATFFDDLTELENARPSLPVYLNTHPASADRAARARAHAEAQQETIPVLTDAEWQALLTICD